MRWYYAENGQRKGPFTPSQFRELVKEGRVQPETLVWHEELPNWTPFREASADLFVEPPEEEPPPADPGPRG